MLLIFSKRFSFFCARRFCRSNFLLFLAFSFLRDVICFCAIFLFVDSDANFPVTFKVCLLVYLDARKACLPTNREERWTIYTAFFAPRNDFAKRTAASYASIPCSNSCRKFLRAILRPLFILILRDSLLKIFRKYPVACTRSLSLFFRILIKALN